LIPSILNLRPNPRSTIVVRSAIRRDSREGHAQPFARQPLRRLAWASETEGNLAHWPPPHRGQEAKPVFMKHQQREPVKRAKLRGGRLTRAIFLEFADFARGYGIELPVPPSLRPGQAPGMTESCPA
jgi:hypothetical protein